MVRLNCSKTLAFALNHELNKIIRGAIMYNEIEYSTKPDINDNRYSVIFNPVTLWFRRGINISVHKPSKYYSRKHINEFVNLLIKEGYIETNKQ